MQRSLRRVVTQQLRLFASEATTSTTTTKQPFTIEGTIFKDGPVPNAFAQLTHTFLPADVAQFAALSGDNNPLHTDPAFAATTLFGKPIVHGLLVSSLFSTLFGRSMHSSIYVSQNLKFLSPVFVGAPITARMTITGLSPKRKGVLLTCATTVVTGDKDTLAVSGEATVLLPQEVFDKLVGVDKQQQPQPPK